MTFREFWESTGSVSGLAPGQWADDNKNGPEFSARGVRKKIEADDENMSKPLRRPPEDVFGLKKKKLDQSELPIRNAPFGR